MSNNERDIIGERVITPEIFAEWAVAHPFDAFQMTLRATIKLKEELVRVRAELASVHDTCNSCEADQQTKLSAVEEECEELRAELVREREQKDIEKAIVKHRGKKIEELRGLLEKRCKVEDKCPIERDYYKKLKECEDLRVLLTQEQQRGKEACAELEATKESYKVVFNNQKEAIKTLQLDREKLRAKLDAITNSVDVSNKLVVKEAKQ